MRYNNEIPFQQEQTQWQEEQEQKKQIETSDDRAKQIEATVHFGSKLLSREILESQFGVLFRPNVAKITRSSLCQTKWSASMTSLLIAAVVAVFWVSVTYVDFLGAFVAFRGAFEVSPFQSYEV